LLKTKKVSPSIKEKRFSFSPPCFYYQKLNSFYQEENSIYTLEAGLLKQLKRKSKDRASCLDYPFKA